MSKDDFNRVLLNAVDEGLSLLGNSSKEAVFHGFEASFKMKKGNIAENLTEFRETLETIFGQGSRSLEEIITIRLCEKLGFDSGKLKSGDLITCADKLRRYQLSNGEMHE